MHNVVILYNLYSFIQHKQKRMSESGPDPVSGSSFFPKVQSGPKPSTFQTAFPAQVTTSTSLPKLGTTSTTYLPTLTQAYVKSKPKVK